MHIKISPKHLLRGLLLIILFLFFLNLMYILAEHYFEHELASKLLQFFFFDFEASVPTFFSCIQLFFCFLLLLIISLKKDKSQMLGWRGLALIFLFLTLDEMVSFHERLMQPIRGALDITSGPLFFAWVIPYSLGLVIFGLLYLDFLLRLPKKIRFLFIVSALTFIVGAIGMELVGAHIITQRGEDNLSYALVVTLEEVLEMIGIAFFIYALALYISEQLDSLNITLGHRAKVEI